MSGPPAQPPDIWLSFGNPARGDGHIYVRLTPPEAMKLTDGIRRQLIDQGARLIRGEFDTE